MVDREQVPLEGQSVNKLQKPAECEVNRLAAGSADERNTSTCCAVRRSLPS